MQDIAQLITNWDRSTFLAINHGLKCPLIDRIVLPITDLGLGQLQVLIVLGVAVVLAIRAGELRANHLLADTRAALQTRRFWIGPLLVSFIVSGITSDVIKLFVPRMRPNWFYLHEHIAGRFLDVTVQTVPGIDPLRVHGFPSGHTATSVALAVVLTILFHHQAKARPLVWLGWFTALCVATSRMYLASHWPLDVLGGAFIGVMSGWLSVSYCRAYARKRRRQPGVDAPVAATVGEQS